MATTTTTTTNQVAIASKNDITTAKKLRAIKSRIEALERQKKILEAELKAAFEIDDFNIAEELRTSTGKLLATYKEVISFPVNVKKLTEENPQIANQYREMKISRRFILK